MNNTSSILSPDHTHVWLALELAGRFSILWHKLVISLPINYFRVNLQASASPLIRSILDLKERFAHQDSAPIIAGIEKKNRSFNNKIDKIWLNCYAPGKGEMQFSLPPTAELDDILHNPCFAAGLAPHGFNVIRWESAARQIAAFRFFDSNSLLDIRAGVDNNTISSNNLTPASTFADMIKPLKNRTPTQDEVKDVVCSIYRTGIEPANKEETLTFAQKFGCVARGNVVWSTLYENFIQHYLYPAGSGGDPRVINLLHNRIALNISRSSVAYILPVLRNLPPAICDIIPLDKPLSEVEIEEMGLSEYKFMAPTKDLSQYKIIVADNYSLHDIKLQAIYREKRMIYISHSVPDSMPYFTPNSLYILTCENLIPCNKRFLTSKGAAYFRPADMQYSECVRTGPFHINFERTEDARYLALEKIHELTGRKIPQHRPVIYVSEALMTNYQHLAYALNRLAPKATIILKLFLNRKRRKPIKLHPDIIVYENDFQNPGVLRDAADFIMAEYYSGTCSSSLMAGIPVLAFYSRVYSTVRGQLRHFSLNEFQKTNFGDEEKHGYRSFFLKEYPFAYNLIDIKSLENAIHNPAWKMCWQEALPELQKRFFGSFLTRKAASRTAEYIIRFACDGTLGNDCAGIWCA